MMMMDTKEKIALANEILGDDPQFSRIKVKDGLIERVQTNKIILTDNNKELLVD